MYSEVTSQGVRFNEQVGFVSGSGGAGSAVPPRQPLLAEIGARLARLSDELSGAENHTGALRERLFGGWPQSSGQTENSAISKAAQGDDLLRLLDTLIERAASVHANASTLNNGV